MNEPTVQAAISTGDIIRLALTTGLATALLNNVFGLSKDIIIQKRASKETGRQFSLTLVDILTEYAKKCASEAENIDGAFEHEYYLATSPPPLEIPLDGPWAHIPSYIAGRIRDLRSETKDSDPEIEATIAMHGPIEGAQTAHFRLCLRGYEAFVLSEKLRRHFRFGRYRIKAGSNFPQFLAAGSASARRSRFRQWWHSYRVMRIRRQVKRLLRSNLRWNR